MKFFFIMLVALLLGCTDSNHHKHNHSDLKQTIQSQNIYQYNDGGLEWFVIMSSNNSCPCFTASTPDRTANYRSLNFVKDSYYSPNTINQVQARVVGQVKDITDEQEDEIENAEIESSSINLEKEDVQEPDQTEPSETDSSADASSSDGGGGGD